MDTTDPDIVFDEAGVCNHCRNYDEKEKERQREKANKDSLFVELRRQGCILGLSGGVDSSTCLRLLCEANIKPFCFSLDNGWNTPESDENIMRLVEGEKVKFERHVLDIEKFKELQKAFLQAGVINAEIPTDHVIVALTYRLAAKYGVKYIISGGNLATESVMPKAWSYPARDLWHIKAIYKRFTGKRLTGLPTLSLPQYLYYRFIKKIKVINLLDYFEYNREYAIKQLQEKYGYKPYGDKHCESKFTKWFQNVYLPELGIDKRRAHLSSLILSGQMTRDEALKELDKLKFLKTVEPVSHYQYPTSDWLWELLSKIYAVIKRRK